MIRVNNEQKNIVDKIDSSNNVNHYLNIKIQKENKIEKKITTSKKSNNDIYQNIRTKASIINSDGRNIQDKISLIQAKEQRIIDIENVFIQTKNEYIQAIENGKNEEVKQKIKIRQLSKQITHLKKQPYEQKEILDELNGYGKQYIEDEEKIVDKINDILRKINSVKDKLSQYKSELLSLSQDIESDKAKIVAQDNKLQRHLDDSDYVINGITINTLNYVDLRGNINTGIIIDIYI